MAGDATFLQFRTGPVGANANLVAAPVVVPLALEDIVFDRQGKESELARLFASGFFGHKMSVWHDPQTAVQLARLQENGMSGLFRGALPRALHSGTGSPIATWAMSFWQCLMPCWQAWAAPCGSVPSSGRSCCFGFSSPVASWQGDQAVSQRAGDVADSSKAPGVLRTSCGRIVGRETLHSISQTKYRESGEALHISAATS